MRILITGGAGFVGSTLALAFAERHPDWEIVALDSLHRRGSELNPPRLAEAGVAFVQGDIRTRDDLEGAGPADVLIECSAEPSAMAGVDGSTEFVFGSNLVGAYECLEHARRHDSYVVFLSTSRVYPYPALARLGLREETTRFELESRQAFPGASERGISEAFPLEGPRTLYGTTKLAAELLIAEYRAMFGLRAVIDRFGVITGPWQMGKVDQGVFALWLLHHHFGRPLAYIGHGAAGKQVRDLLHVDDVVDLVELQVADPDHWDGETFNVGGGREISLSLVEATELCRELTGREVPIAAEPRGRPGDVPVYLSDCSALERHTAWRPQRDARRTFADIHEWIAANEESLAASLGI